MPKFYVSTPKGDESYDYHLAVFSSVAATPQAAAQYFANTFRGTTVPPKTVYVIETANGLLTRFNITRPTGYAAVRA